MQQKMAAQHVPRGGRACYPLADPFGYDVLPYHNMGRP